MLTCAHYIPVTRNNDALRQSRTCCTGNASCTSKQCAVTTRCCRACSARSILHRGDRRTSTTPPSSSQSLPLTQRRLARDNNSQQLTPIASILFGFIVLTREDTDGDVHTHPPLRGSAHPISVVPPLLPVMLTCTCRTLQIR